MAPTVMFVPAQSTIEGELDKRGGKNFGPPSGCGMTVFLDDVSMPEVSHWRFGRETEINRNRLHNFWLKHERKAGRSSLRRIR